MNDIERAARIAAIKAQDHTKYASEAEDIVRVEEAVTAARDGKASEIDKAVAGVTAGLTTAIENIHARTSPQDRDKAIDALRRDLDGFVSLCVKGTLATV